MTAMLSPPGSSRLNIQELVVTGEPKPKGDSATFKAVAPPLSRTAKRSFDIVVALIGLILFSPICLLSAVAIMLGSRGPVLRTHVRHGYGNQTFPAFKFRSTTTANISGDLHASRTGSRLTRVGHILRSSAIEGLPQLINVLRGEMSIVGPRSYAAPLRETFQNQILQISRRGTVRPGLTGWAQINGCCDESDSTDVIRRRIEYDLYYVENWSFLLDMKIILITLCSKKALRAH